MLRSRSIAAIGSSLVAVLAVPEVMSDPTSKPSLSPANSSRDFSVACAVAFRAASTMD